MAVEALKKKGINQFLIIVSGLFFLFGAILIYLLILRGIFGKFDAAELVPDSKAIHTILYGKQPEVAILYSQYTQNMLPKGSTWETDNIKTWKKFLSENKFTFDIITDSVIELGKQYPYKVIILPGSRSLSDKEIIELKKYINNGGSVFATSGTATYSGDGKWRGWDFFSEVFGLKFSNEISSGEPPRIHTLRGGLPITSNIPAGFPLKVATWDRPIAAEVLDPRTTQASFWYNYRIQEGLSREQIKKSAGIAYGSYGSGRFVWMGFEINSVIGVQEEYIYFDRLFNNCMNWLTYHPVAFIKDWPSNYSAAAIISPSLSKEANNINNLLPVLKKEDVKATFCIDPYIAKNYKGLIKILSSYGDLASLVDLGYIYSVNDTVNKLYNYKTQLEKLLYSRNEIESASQVKISGCVPYYGLYDKNTILALSKAGYKYIFSDSLSDGSEPRTFQVGDSLIIGITKTGRDDYEVIRDFGLTDPDYQFYTYQEDVDRVLFEGGLYVYKLHSEFQCKQQNVNVVGKVIEDLKKKNFWITTASEIKNWWNRKKDVQIRVTQRGERRIALIISNPVHYFVGNFVIQLDMNQPARNLQLSSEIIGTKSAKFDYNPEKRTVYIYINNLEPDESRTYYIDFEKPQS